MPAIPEGIFRSYDIRGIYPDKFNEEAAYHIAQAYVEIVRPKGPVVVGKDVRTHSPQIFEKVVQGLTDMGVDVIDIGTISTDMMYFSVGYYGYAGGIAVTASHNPKNYNGMKMVRENVIPISGETGIMQMKELVQNRTAVVKEKKGSITKKKYSR